MNRGVVGFESARSIPIGVSSVTPVDVNDDLVLDLAVVTWERTDATILIGDGQGSFTAALDLGLDDRGSTTSLNGIGVVDLDGDGRMEIALSAPEKRGLLVLSPSETSEATVRASARNYEVLAEPHAATLGDIDGDGDIDVVTGDGGFAQITLLLNNGSGVLARLRSYPVPGYIASLDLEDLDGDGDLDLIVADSSGESVFVMRNEGEAVFSTAGRLPVGRSPFHVMTGDYSGDGIPDVLTANSASGNVSLLAGLGDGTFRRQEVLDVGGAPRGAALAEVDGDGVTDIAVVSDGTSELVIFHGTGGGRFDRGAMYDVQAPSAVIAADFDGDDDLDLAVASENFLAVFIFPNSGDGTFGPPTTIEVGHGPRSLAAADMSGDGALDVVTANQASNTVSMSINDGAGVFAAPFYYGVGTHPRFVLPADLDADGDMDLVSANHTSSDVTVLLNTTLLTHLDRICLEVDFLQVAASSSRPGPIVATTKYLAPANAGDPTLLPPVFQNVHVYPLHQEFLAETFPDHFPGLSADAYERIVGRRATRKYFAGIIYLVETNEGPVYGFNVLANYFADPDEVPTIEEVRGVYETLSSAFTLRPLVYFPDEPLVRDVVAAWQNPGFPVRLDDLEGEILYEPYTRAVGYGRVRILDAAEFEAANAVGQISFQDILVLDRAPRDIEGVVGGIITGERQSELSHVAIRTARRGTPNAFVADATLELLPYADRLVRLEVRESELVLGPATPEEAAAWWEASRPELSVLPGIDPDFTEFVSLVGIAAADVAGGDVPMEARFGGKATNLARLQPLLQGELEQYRERGFGIPVHYYLEFMRANHMPSALDPARDVTYEEYVAELIRDEQFQSDSATRFASLERLREHMRDRGAVDPDLVRRLARHISEVFETSTSRVRFRSSSNVEDAIEFNGAGLYDSTSVCAQDDLDGDGDGPSHCDPSREKERGVARGLKKVWASLWNFRAFEERAFYGIPQDAAAMGILVNRAFIDERVNGVAFTGNLTNPMDRRYVITAQIGENSVVSPDPGILPEKNVLELENGRVVKIVRASTSTLAEPGRPVMTVEELRELGTFLWHLEQRFPIDAGNHRPEDVLLDVEFKIEANGDLAVKQVRPFLVADAAPPPPTFELEIPPGVRACGTFVPFRSPGEALALKSTIAFHEGRIALPAREESFELELFSEVFVGTDGRLAVPRGAGTMTLGRPTIRGETVYRFDYRQEFTLPSGEEFEIKLSNLTFSGRRDAPPVKRLDEELATRHLDAVLRPNLAGQVFGADDSPLISYGICPPNALRRWRIEVQLEDGSFVRLDERHDPPPTVNHTGPASLVGAQVQLRGISREVTDYWSLVYAAGRHNRNVIYWIVLDPPIEVAGIARGVRFVEVIAPEPIPPKATEAVRYLDESGVVIDSPAVVAFRREEVRDADMHRFVRGDVSADGSVNLTDAIQVLDSLFQGGPEPACARAADANDDGQLNLSDAVALLLHLVGGAGNLPAPFPDCGLDPTEDPLHCAAHAACE